MPSMVQGLNVAKDSHDGAPQGRAGMAKPNDFPMDPIFWVVNSRLIKVVARSSGSRQVRMARCLLPIKRWMPQIAEKELTLG